MAVMVPGTATAGGVAIALLSVEGITRARTLRDGIRPTTGDVRHEERARVIASFGSLFAATYVVVAVSEQKALERARKRNIELHRGKTAFYLGNRVK
jgi:hypothetical protein